MIAWLVLACDPPSTGSTDGGPSPEGTAETAAPSTGGHSTAETGHTAVGTGDTAGSEERVLPLCDLTPPAPAATEPLAVLLQDVRSASIYGVAQWSFYFGDWMAIATHSTGERELLVTAAREAEARFFPLPLGRVTSSEDARSGVERGSGLQDALGNLTGDAGDELITTIPGMDIEVVPLPTPDGFHAAESLASASGDGEWVPDIGNLDAGDWDGAGHDDLFFTWQHGNDAFGGRRPPLPYDWSGAAVYLGPLPPTELDLLGADAPAAWYDLSPYANPAFVKVPPTLWMRGSRLVPDVDGDGADEVLVSYQNGIDPFERDPPPPNPGHDAGGFALFGGGNPGHQKVDDARVTIAATCGSDVYALATPTCGTEIPFSTMPYEVGDLDGDGREDLVFLADTVDVAPGRCYDAAFVVTRLPYVSGPVTYTEVSSMVVFTSRGLYEAAGVGDLNGDGRGELALSQWGVDGLGRVLLFLSPHQGLVDLESADLEILPGPSAGHEFGSLASGEVDGDGVPDLIVGDITDRGDVGAVHVVSGAALQRALGL